jgi:hypothetical protein
VLRLKSGFRRPRRARPCYRRRKGSHRLKGGWKGANFLDVPSEFYRLMRQPISQSHRPFERATALHIASRSVRGPTAKKSVSKAMRLILTGSVLPLRTTSYLTMDSGIGSPIAEV